MPSYFYCDTNHILQALLLINYVVIPMLIEQIKLTKTKKHIALSAGITFKSTKKQTMYFLTERQYETFIANDASPFLAAVLIPCMKTGENIIIHGTVSQQLLRNTKRIMNLLLSWNRHLHAVEIHADSVIKDTFTPRHTGTFFSAGVDSFYTYLKYKKTISHLIFVNGFDIELDNKRLFHQTLKNIQAVAKKENVNVITVETNCKYIIEPVYVWDWIHGAALAAVGLFLRKDLKQLYISGAVRKEYLFPYGTHPDLDPLWSSEKLHFDHIGTEYSRFDKTVHYIAKSDLALSFLHICAENTKGTYNCGHCAKCLRTMIQLSAANALQKSKTFPHTLNLNMVRDMYHDYSQMYNVDMEDVIKLLEREQREPELVAAIKESLEKSKKGPSLSAKVINAVAHFDQEYNHRRLYSFVFAMNKVHDRNALFKTFVQLGIIK